jgi:hypothetical protein
MSCGVVLLYLDRLPAIAQEFREARDSVQETSPAIEPAPIKS